MKECPNCKELIGDNVNSCFNCHYNFGLKRVESSNEIHKNNAIKEREITNKNKFYENERIKMQQDRSNYKEYIDESESNKIKLNDIYEYDVITVNDFNTGETDINSIRRCLSEHAMMGWRLRNAFTNEMGNESRTLGIGGCYSGTNAVIDQVVLIFERCIKRYGNK